MSVEEGSIAVMQLALLRGEPIVAFDLTNEEFDALKVEVRADRGVLRFPDGLEAIPRRGTRVHAHFAHKAGEGGGEAETIHHVAAKKAIREVALARGWQAQLEARSPEGDWRADVLLTRDSRRVAFEVQWSHQDLTDYRDRTLRYAADGIETVWLAKYTHRTWGEIERAVQALPYQPEKVGAYGPTFPLDRAIDACLGHLEVAATIPVDAPSHAQAKCYRCGKKFGYHPASAYFGEKVPFTEAELRALGSWAALLKPTYSKTAKTTYSAWHCPHCGAMQGDVPLSQERNPLFALVNDRIVPDTRGRRYWDLVRERLSEEQVPVTTRPVQGSISTREAVSKMFGGARYN